jgi:dTDP-4-amino-4,6-dideoxygalactose transaminase
VKIPYASPNLRAVDLAISCYVNSQAAGEKIRGFFSELTGKKYILLTNSCRTALYLAYMSIRAKGEVITSPLTCRAAIDPVIESGNTPVFADISLGDLNVRTDDIEHRITEQTVAIQTIHLGGVSCKMDEIQTIGKKAGLAIIEDCAQSLGAVYKGKPTGTLGDVACFSLIKNAYGIGGGILATNNCEIYEIASQLNASWERTPLPLLLFRLSRNMMDSKRKHQTVFSLYDILMSIKPGRSSCRSVTGQLHRIAPIEKQIAAHQITRFPNLHEKRRNIGMRYCEALTKHGVMSNKGFDIGNSSYTKFYVYHPRISTERHLKALRCRGIEAMHLEQKYGSPVQKRLVPNDITLEGELPNYDSAHDRLISLPLIETMSEIDIEYVVNQLVGLIH